MIAIIDYQAGNIRSVQNAFKRLNTETVLTADPGIIRKADKVIFPGVGEAKFAMESLRKNGLIELIPQLTQPTLGICLGMQLMCSHSEEGNTLCLGIFETQVKRFASSNPKDKIPHMGWNNHTKVSNELFNGVTIEEDFYFVHSYYAEISENAIAECEYILPFSSALQKNNFYATQFHPEKSAQAGQRVLQNFLTL